jgi:hypothetical protein
MAGEKCIDELIAEVKSKVEDLGDGTYRFVCSLCERTFESSTLLSEAVETASKMGLVVDHELSDLYLLCDSCNEEIFPTTGEMIRTEDTEQ